METIYLAAAQAITENGQFTFSNNQLFAGFYFTNPDDTNTAYVDGHPVLPLQTMSFSVNPGQVCGNRTFQITLGSVATLYAAPIVYGN